MDRAMELEVVKSAFFLEDRIDTLEGEGAELRRNKPKQPKPPTEPKLGEIYFEPFPYPPIEVTIPEFLKMRYGLIAGLAVSFLGFMLFALTLTTDIPFFLGTLGMLCIPAIIVLPIIWFVKNRRLTSALSNEIRNSEAYKQSCEQVDKQNRQLQVQCDENCRDDYTKSYAAYQKAIPVYEEKLKHHQEVEIPEWSEERTLLENTLTESQRALQELYSRNDIPAQYRNYSALLWLSSFLGTSKYDLAYAIERYDTYVMQAQQRKQIQLAEAQLAVAQEQLQNQHYANYLFEQNAELTAKGNQTLKSISNWQKADTVLREYRRAKEKRAAKR